MSSSEAKDHGITQYESIMNRSKKVRFYIPIEKDGADEVVETVVRRLADLFGGATQLPAKGAYVMNDGELCCENVTLVESFATDTDTTDLTRLALEIKETLGEEAVVFEIDSIESAFV